MKRNLFSFKSLVATFLLFSFSTGASTASASPAIAGCPIFPADNIWNTPVDNLPVSSSSIAYINSIGAGTALHADFGSGLWEGAPFGIPYNIVLGNQPKVGITFDYADESDPGPYPIPSNPLIEGGSQATGDRHILVLDKDACKLYELWSAYPNPDGTWQAGSGAVFDLSSNRLRTDGWTSADAAGLPILPGLVRYDEVEAGEIRHALRFTVSNSRNEYVWPGRHQASNKTNVSYPPMGQRFRLKAGFDVSKFSPQMKVILQAMKKYGIILADNGSNWYISGTQDERWDNDLMSSGFSKVKGSDFEAVEGTVPMFGKDFGRSMAVLNPNPPDHPVRLIFVHHSTGQNWLDDANGALGTALRDANYFVSDTNYGWGPDGIGDHTDIGEWWNWFRGPSSANYLASLYNESGQHSSYSRLPTPPPGENQIIMFKSCFPNSALQGNVNAIVPSIDVNPLRGQTSGSDSHTVANAKGIYIDLLNYFKSRRDKLFVGITAPPLSDPAYAENARAFNEWLVNEWLADYPYRNVAVFDFYNVLTTNGGDTNTNDLLSSTGNHHRWWQGGIQHKTNGDNDTNPNVLEYASGDDHPSKAGNLKATGEFASILNIFYHNFAYASASPRDFNGDGKPDILWRDSSSGQNVVWYMDGTTHTGDGSIQSVPVNWQIVGAGDFNGDGKSDILWRDSTTGQNVVWYMDGTAHTGDGSIQSVPVNWQIVGTGDFNGDVKTDILWRDSTTGQIIIWLMDGTTHTGDVPLGSVPVNWKIVGIGDFNGDGKSDILWRDTTTGQNVVWYMDGTTHTGDGSIQSVPVNWQIVGAGDFNGDVKPDILWRDSATGQIIIWLMDGTTHTGDVSLGSVPVNWKIVGM